MQGKLPASDDHQIALADYIRVYEGDDAAWMQRLDKQFVDHQQEGNVARIIRWIGLYARHPAKMEEYLRKLDFAKMSNGEILSLVYTVLQSGGDPALARNAFAKLRWDEMDDAAKSQICDWMQNNHGYRGSREMGLAACQVFKDVNAGKMRALRYYHWRCQHHHLRSTADFAEGLELASELQKVPDTAKAAFSLGGNMLQWSGKYEEAIQAYQQADSPPRTLFWTAE